MVVFELLTRIVEGEPPSLPQGKGFSPEFCDFVGKWYVDTHGGRDRDRERERAHTPSHTHTHTFTHTHTHTSLHTYSPSLARSMRKAPKERAALTDLLQHPFISDKKELEKVDMAEWVQSTMVRSVLEERLAEKERFTPVPTSS